MRLADELALLQGEDAGDGLQPLAYEVGRLAHDLTAVVGGHGAPYLVALLCGLERLVEVGRAGVRQLAEGFFGGRIKDRFAVAAVGLDPCPVDEEPEFRVHDATVRRLMWLERGVGKKAFTTYTEAAPAESTRRRLALFFSAFHRGQPMRL